MSLLLLILLLDMLNKVVHCGLGSVKSSLGHSQTISQCQRMVHYHRLLHLGSLELLLCLFLLNLGSCKLLLRLLLLTLGIHELFLCDFGELHRCRVLFRNVGLGDECIDALRHARGVN